MTFVGLVLLLTLFELGLSFAIGTSELFGKKGLASDVLAAIVMFIFGIVYEAVGLHVYNPCMKIKEMGITGTNDCIELGKSVMSFGMLMRTTMGMHVIVAAVVFYFLFSYSPLLIVRFMHHKN